MSDIHNYARYLIAQYGDHVHEEVRRKIKNYSNSHNFNGLKTWYEIEEAIWEIESQLVTSDSNVNHL